MIRYRLAMPICAITALVVLITGNSQAQEQAAAAPLVICFAPPAKMSDEEVKSFIDMPASLLPSFETGGLPLSTRIRSLAGSSSATLDPILALAPGANPAQIAAIGAGLARTARACTVSNPDYAALIQQKVAELNNQSLILAFASGLNDVQTAALGGAAGGGAGGAGASAIGGDGDAGGGIAGLGGDESTPTTSGTFNVNASSRFFSSNDGGGSTTDTGSPN